MLPKDTIALKFGKIKYFLEIYLFCFFFFVAAAAPRIATVPIVAMATASHKCFSYLQAY
jgi:hypothetical protein